VISLRSVLTEAAVFSVFLVGAGVSRWFKRRWTGGEIMVMYFMGLLFEVMSSYMWHYHYLFLLLPTPVAPDISVLQPLAWGGLIMTATPLAESAWSRWKVTRWWKRHLILMGIWLLVGGVAETVFYDIGMTEYVRQPNTEYNFIFGQLPGFPPTLILAAYPLVQPLGTVFLRWLERGLQSPGAPRARRA